MTANLIEILLFSPLVVALKFPLETVGRDNVVFIQLLWQSVFICSYVEHAVAVSSKWGKTRMVKLLARGTVAGLSLTVVSLDCSEIPNSEILKTNVGECCWSRLHHSY